MEEPQVPTNYPVSVRQPYTAVQIPVPEKEEDGDSQLVGWVKTNLFAIISVLASLLTLYASSQVKPIVAELDHQKEDILAIKTAQAQVLGVMDTKYANKEMTDLQYQTLNNSVGEIKESLKTLIDLHTTNKSK